MGFPEGALRQPNTTLKTRVLARVGPPPPPYLTIPWGGGGGPDTPDAGPYIYIYIYIYTLFLFQFTYLFTAFYSCIFLWGGGGLLKQMVTAVGLAADPAYQTRHVLLGVGLPRAATH